MTGIKTAKPLVWDIYNAEVFYEDKIQKKIRPVLVIDEINNICMSLKITHNTKRTGVDEYTIVQWKESGLDTISNVRISKLIPLARKYLKDKRGVLQMIDREALIKQIETYLILNNAKYTLSLLKKMKRNIDKNK